MAVHGTSRFQKSWNFCRRQWPQFEGDWLFFNIWQEAIIATSPFIYLLSPRVTCTSSLRLKRSLTSKNGSKFRVVIQGEVWGRSGRPGPDGSSITLSLCWALCYRLATANHSFFRANSPFWLAMDLVWLRVHLPQGGEGRVGRRWRSFPSCSLTLGKSCFLIVLDCAKLVTVW